MARAKKKEESRDYWVYLDIENKDTANFLKDFETVSGCHYEITDIKVGSLKLVRMTIDHRKSKDKEILVRGGRPSGSRNKSEVSHSVSEVYLYCHEDGITQQEAAEHFGMSLRTFQRRVQAAKQSSGGWNADNEVGEF